MISTREPTPSDYRMLQRLALEIRLCIESAKFGPRQANVFAPDARRHTALLRELLRDLDDGPEVAVLNAYAWRAWLALLRAARRPSRFRWPHRSAWLHDAAVALYKFDRCARQAELALWEA